MFLPCVVFAGRTGRAGTRGRATSFFTDRDAFLVSQIKTALAELEKGNVAAFAMGKEARQAEKALAQKFKSNMKLSSEGLVATGSGLAPAVKVDGKYAYMATAAASASAGAADAAWVSCAGCCIRQSSSTSAAMCCLREVLRWMCASGASGVHAQLRTCTEVWLASKRCRPLPPPLFR
jgi:hypothetical protein